MRGEKYYKLLGLKGTESDAEVKKRYRDLAKKYHPDKNTTENSTAQFQALQDAYDRILKQQFELETNKINKAQKTPAQQFHENARKRAEEQLRQDEKDRLLFYASFRSGWRKMVIKITAVLAVICILGLLSDDYLPLRNSIENIKSYNPVPSKSIDDNYVYSVTFKNNQSLWLNYNGAHNLENLSSLIVFKTYLFHQPVFVINKTTNLKAAVHFTFYWAQTVLLLFAIIPIIIIFYRKNDLFFVLGNYFSLTISSSTLVFFLLNDLKIIHLFTLGFY